MEAMKAAYIRVTMSPRLDKEVNQNLLQYYKERMLQNNKTLTNMPCASKHYIHPRISVSLQKPQSKK